MRCSQAKQAASGRVFMEPRGRPGRGGEGESSSSTGHRQAGGLAWPAGFEAGSRTRRE
jgi:hypothetical protein